jgi:small subunit ribosomal protein S1
MSWTKRVKHPSKLLEEGEAVEAVILDIDPSQKRISLGLKQTEENPWVLLEERYPIGAKVRGKVRNITNFGIFVGIEDGIDGLVHISDLSWSPKITHPQELFEKGDEVEAMVLHIDPDKERFSLGVKQLEADPWEDIDRRFPIGNLIEGKVTKLLDFGAIVELDPFIEGLIHISELSHEKVESVDSVVKEGDVIRAKVINLIPEERKIGLSVKRLSQEESQADYDKFLAHQTSQATTRFAELLKGVNLGEGEEGAEAAVEAAEAPAAVEAVEAPAAVEAEAPAAVEAEAPAAVEAEAPAAVEAEAPAAVEAEAPAAEVVEAAAEDTKAE